MTHEEVDALVQKRLSEKRYNHTLSVARLTSELAKQYGVDEEKAFVAAMLHDITKEEEIEAQLQMIVKYGTINDTRAVVSNSVLHSVTAMLFAKNVLNISDEDVLNAIHYHTTGRCGMSVLEKIIFTADTVSYDRTYKDAERLRKLSFKDLDGTMLEITRFIISSLVEKGKPIQHDTIDCYNSVLKGKDA